MCEKYIIRFILLVRNKILYYLSVVIDKLVLDMYINEVFEF